MTTSIDHLIQRGEAHYRDTITYGTHAKAFETIRARRRWRAAGYVATAVAAAGALAVGVLTMVGDTTESAELDLPGEVEHLAPLDPANLIAEARPFDPDADGHAIAQCAGTVPVATDFGFPLEDVYRGGNDIGFATPPCELSSIDEAGLIEASIIITPDPNRAGGVVVSTTISNPSTTPINVRYGSLFISLVVPEGTPLLGRHSSANATFGGGVGAWGLAWDGGVANQEFYGSPNSTRLYPAGSSFGFAVRSDNPLQRQTDQLQRVTSIDRATFQPGERISIIMFLGYEAAITHWERLVLSNYADFDWVEFFTENIDQVSAFVQIDVMDDSTSQSWPITLIATDVPVMLFESP